jgi:ABC-2 type transport system ATP-binding protein
MEAGNGSDAPRRGAGTIEASELTRAFGRRKAVDGLDLSVRRGELFSLLGPNGAGKTTTIRMLCCLLRPSGGSATVGGMDIEDDPTGVKRVISVSPQETAVAGNLNAWENLSLMARLHGLGKAETRARSGDLLEMLALENRARERVRKYSGGMKRRLSIAMALVSDPEVLFLDEPTLGLDPQARRGLWEHIEGLKGDTTIVLTTHYLEEADALADRIGVIDEGRLIALGTSDELKDAVPGSGGTLVEAELDDEAFAAVQRAFPGARRSPEGALIESEEVSLDQVIDVLRPLGVAVRGAHRRRATLDDVFVHLTGKQLRE